LVFLVFLVFGFVCFINSLAVFLVFNFPILFYSLG
jgi:hypothetical protein